MKIIILLFVLFCVSCQNKEKIVYYNSFPKEINLVGEKVEVCEELYSAMFLSVIDTLLIGHNSFFTNPEGLINIFSTNDFKNLGSCFRRGKGPCEFIARPSIELKDIDNNGINVVACAWNIPKLNYINITKTLEDKYIAIDTTILCKSINKENFTVIGIENNLIYLKCSDEFYNDNIIVYNTNDDKVEEIVELTNWTYSENNTKLSCGKSVLNQDKTKIITAYLYMDKLVIDDLKDKSKRMVISTSKSRKIDSYEDLKSEDHFNLKVCYLYVECVDNLIFALRLKTPVEDSKQIMTQTEIQVFDSNGNPICLLNTSEKLKHFTIDKQKKRIYTIVNSEFYVYDISAILND